MVHEKKQIISEKNFNTVCTILKEKEQRDGLTKKHKQVLKNIERYFKIF